MFIALGEEMHLKSSVVPLETPLAKVTLRQSELIT